MKMNRWLWLLAAWAVSYFLMKLGLGAGQLGVILIPLTAIVLGVSTWSEKRDRHTKELASEFGGGFKYSHLEGPTGIAIDPDRKILRLRSNGDTGRPATKDYPFSAIRDFEKLVFSGGQIVGQHSAGPNMQSAVGASLANIGVAAQNARIKRDNQKRSGIFIAVKDIEHPKWQVAFSDEKGMDRWMEILRQCLAD